MGGKLMMDSCRDVNKNANLGTIDTNMAQKGRRSLKSHERSGVAENWRSVLKIRQLVACMA